MSPWQHALALLALIAALAASLVLLGAIVGVTWSWLAVVGMCYFLAIAKLAEPLVVLRLPRALERSRDWEPGLMRRLGVLHFGELLRRRPLRYLNERVYLDPRRRGPREVRAQAASAEACHFWAALLLLPFLLFAGARGHWGALAGLAVAQVLVNVYPILHLRHVRARLERTIGRSRDDRGSARPVRGLK